MQAGKLNRLVQIQRHVTGKDAAGQPATGWVAVASVWADIRHVSGREYVRSDADVSRAVVSIRIRYRSDMDAGMRVVHEGRVYSIEAVMPDAAGRAFVDLVCSVGANDG